MKNSLLVLSIVLFQLSAYTQQKQTDTLALTFVAHTAVPASGGTQHLTGVYDLRINEGRVISFLPFFGRSFFSTSRTDGGIKFTSYQYEIKQSTSKKGIKEIRIRFRDVPEVRQMHLSISPNGHATLQVISNHRQNITFYGEIR